VEADLGREQSPRPVLSKEGAWLGRQAPLEGGGSYWVAVAGAAVRRRPSQNGM